MSKFLPKGTITQEQVRLLLNYNPETGVFTWINPSRRSLAGAVAGSVTPLGYIRITVSRRRFMAHTLAWLYMTGELVVRGIDHRDTNGTNNRWANLRRASASQNTMNTKVRSDNALGIKCVLVKKGNRNKPYYSTITIKGRQTYLGYFATPEEASKAYADAAKKHFGEFARTS